jgi:hypothetical protein
VLGCSLDVLLQGVFEAARLEKWAKAVRVPNGAVARQPKVPMGTMSKLVLYHQPSSALLQHSMLDVTLYSALGTACPHVLV